MYGTFSNNDRSAKNMRFLKLAFCGIDNSFLRINQFLLKMNNFLFAFSEETAAVLTWEGTQFFNDAVFRKQN